jgi:hypothetical protein
MNICCISSSLSNSDMILIITAIILLLTLIVIQKGNLENARFNRLQAVENTIMKQLEFHNNILKGINVNIALAGRGYGFPDAPNTAYGQDAFEILYEILKHNYVTMPGNSYKNSQDIDAEERRIKDSFTQLYNEYGSKFGNYFKNLYLLVKYISDSKIKRFDKGYYIDLVKSQLSKYEILLLAYNCIWIQDKPKGSNFIELAKKNNLLSALETDELISSENVSEVKHKDIFVNRYGITFSKPIVFTN